MRSYLDGQTPNPCVECNRFVKWERLLYIADSLGAEYIATGHYASVIKLDNGCFTVKQAAHAEKDQTYMLCKLTQSQLSRTVMPLGSYSKEEVRELAKKAGMTVFDKPDSQEICFVTDDDYSSFIEKNCSLPIPGEGLFKDENGNTLGRHKGITHYTVGQRKGLGLAMGHPVYVKRIDSEKNEVIIADECALYQKSVKCVNINYMGIPPQEIGKTKRAKVKIRYRHSAQPALVVFAGDEMTVEFDDPVKSPTPGQYAVAYDENDCIICAGTISK